MTIPEKESKPAQKANPDEETLRQIDALATRSPSDVSTQRAIAAARSALTDVAGDNFTADESTADESTANDARDRGAYREGIVASSHGRWRRDRVLRSLAVGGTAVAIAVAIWMFVSAPGSLAFAQVQEKLNRVRTVRYTFVAESPDGSGKSVSIQYVVSGNRVRADWPGKTQIHRPKQNRILLLDHKERTAEFTIGPVRLDDKYRWLTTVEDSSVKDLGESTINGRRVVGFEVPERGSEKIPNSNMKVWVDPDTRLPVKIEAIGNRILQDFIFESEVRDELFALKVPEGYFVERRFANPPTEDIPKADLETYASIVGDAKRSSGQTVVAFLKLSGAGKRKLASKLQRNPSSDDLRELDGFADLRIEAVYRTDNRALVVTNTAVSNRGEKRGLIFTLEASKAGWIIDDIDLESTNDLQEKTQQFRIENPKAVKVDSP